MTSKSTVWWVILIVSHVQLNWVTYLPSTDEKMRTEEKSTSFRTESQEEKGSDVSRDFLLLKQMFKAVNSNRKQQK